MGCDKFSSALNSYHTTETQVLLCVPYLGSFRQLQYNEMGICHRNM